MKKLITKDMIEAVLISNPETRNSDELLFWWVMNIYNIYIHDIEVVKAGNNVKRVRAKFNQKGMYLPTNEKIVEKRKKLSEIYKRMYT